MEEKRRCSRCKRRKVLTEFNDRSAQNHHKRSTCKLCDQESNYYRYHHGLSTTKSRQKVNTNSRIDMICSMEAKAQEFLSCKNFEGLRQLIQEMKDFGLKHRAHELELEIS